MRKPKHAGALSGLLLLTLTLAASASYIENFDAGDAGWHYTTLNDKGKVKYHSPIWHDSGGESGGFISVNLNEGQNRLYGFEPSNVGVFGDLAGKVLTVDTMLEGLVSGPGPRPTARFYVGAYSGGTDYFVSSDSYSWDLNQDVTWTLHQVPLTSAAFVRWPNQAANSRSFDEVLVDIQDIGIVFTDREGTFRNISLLGISGAGATLGIDNFGVVHAEGAVPEPATLMLLALGAVPCLAARRRRPNPA